MSRPPAYTRPLGRKVSFEMEFLNYVDEKQYSPRDEVRIFYATVKITVGQGGFITSQQICSDAVPAQIEPEPYESECDQIILATFAKYGDVSPDSIAKLLASLE